MPVNLRDVVEYLCHYIEWYHHRYDAFTSPQPRGGGYPKLPISAYLTATKLHCYLASNGVAIAAYDDSWKNEGLPFEGGVFFIKASNIEPGADPLNSLRNSGINPKMTYAIRGSSNQPMDQMAMEGNLGPPIDAICKSSLGIRISGTSYDLDFAEMIRRLTLGAFCGILTPTLPTEEDPFWQPWIFTKIGFVTDGLRSQRLFNYLELTPHCDDAAWDKRAIFARLESDIRRDLARTLSTPPGGLIAPPGITQWVESYWDRLTQLEQTITQFQQLLETRS